MPKNIIAYISILFFIISLAAGFLFYKSQKNVIEAPIITPSPVAVIKEEKYKNGTLGFELTLPTGLAAEEKTEGKVILIGDKILIYELVSDPELCKGVCSILTKKEDITVNDLKARYLEGYWEALGEDNAQSFVSYVIPRDGKYLVFMLQELPIGVVFEKGRKSEQIDPKTLAIFDSLIKSVRLY